MGRKASKTDKDAPDTITIKKYANRRLYNTASSSYVTLDDLATMVQDGLEFTVHDAKTNEDITRAVLTQIIVEQEAKGNNLLPTGFLRQLISFYGDNLQGVVPQYLDMTMQSFAHNQEKMRSYMENAFGGIYPFSSFEEVGRKNMAMFEQAMNMMSPFNAQENDSTEESPAGDKDEKGSAESLDTMKAQLEAMQRQLDTLSKNNKG
ncbi:MAG: polyhydroxyalkanoate synthesis repressor PhaR [Rhodospirillaceae bacterium]|nr:polyhydroxyalkanoate synthesis repressor PhaR [Rhodospirillaceae bacterium]RPG04406.1 MAG: polyhydroxyalkanoate synthesis repressor PhaR [Rhodospirillaceae bacterium TMED63]RZO38943.1 MAG: polyhydroxyalkanoate synthesis repressor PhaR [Rhodospirillaceae bacterium]